MPGQHRRDGSGYFEGELNQLTKEEQDNADAGTKRTRVTGEAVAALDKASKPTKKAK